MTRLSLAEFADRIADVMQEVMKESMHREMKGFHSFNVTMPQFVTLNCLNKYGSLKMKDLANFMNVTTAAMTGVIDRLVREKHVSRESSPDDRRIVKINLTPKGKKVVEDMIKRRKQMIMKLFGMISQHEREEYLKILTHIKNSLISDKTALT